MLGRRTNVVVLHPSPVLNAGVRALLADECDVRAGDFARVPESADVVIADHEQALALMHAMATGLPARCLVVSARLNGRMVREAMEAGAHGYVTAECAGPELNRAVQSVNLGQRYLCSGASACLANSFGLDPLTRRELQVLELLGAGLGNKSIALRLDIALGTVKAHVRTVLDKLCVSSRTQAVIEARRRGLLGDDDELATPAAAAR